MHYAWFSRINGHIFALSTGLCVAYLGVEINISQDLFFFSRDPPRKKSGIWLTMKCNLHVLYLLFCVVKVVKTVRAASHNAFIGGKYCN